MFVRVRKAKTKKEGIVEYVYLVENRWNPVLKKHQQKIIASLGRRDEIEDSRILDKFILALKTFSSKEKIATQSFVIDSLNDKRVLSSAKDYGVYWLTEKLMEKLSFDKIIKKIAPKDKGKKVSLKNILTSLTALLSYRLTRSQDKLSERACFNWFKKDLFFPKKHKSPKQKLDLNYLYRTLDFLIENKEEIEKGYYQQNRNLFNQKLDLVLFDTTSIYYWGNKGEAALKTKQNPDEALLRYSGYSKDKRTDLKQVIVGVLMAEDLSGKPIPVAHEAFPGNCSDFVSFPYIIKKVKKKYQIKKVIFIADKGMVSEQNLRTLEQQGMEYVLGVRIGQLNLILKKALITRTGTLDDKQYLSSMKRIKDNLYAKEFAIKDLLKKGSLWPHPKDKKKRISGKKAIDILVNTIYKNLCRSGSQTADEKKDKADIRRRLFKRRYFICFNPYIAQDRQEKRKFFKKVIADKIKYEKNKSWIVKNGYKKYLKVGKLDIRLDRQKLNQEKYFDGKWVLLTNSKTTTASLATHRYKSLRFVEQGFKDLKSEIKVRPFFHSKEERIKAHIFVAFLALIIKWYICQALDSTSQKAGKDFIKSINRIKAIEVDRESQIWVRSEIDKKTLNHFKALKITPPQKLLLDRRRYQTAPPERKYIKPKKKKQAKAKQKTNRYGGRNLTLPLF